MIDSSALIGDDEKWPSARALGQVQSGTHRGEKSGPQFGAIKQGVPPSARHACRQIRPTPEIVTTPSISQSAGLPEMTWNGM